MPKAILAGKRSVIPFGSDDYPQVLSKVPRPPKELFVVGNEAALKPGLAIVGARKATPYGISCARRFARLAAEREIVVVSGGARGCDAAAHRGALEVGSQTVVVLGGGADCLYPAEHSGLFQQVVDAGGAVVSEHTWDAPALPKQFRTRNRIIAGLSLATLIVEAGLPSGTFSTADEALAAGREVFAVPGAITSTQSRGSNRLIYQGATPIVDDESFSDVLFDVFVRLKQDFAEKQGHSGDEQVLDRDMAILVDALQAAPMNGDEIYDLVSTRIDQENLHVWLMTQLVEGEQRGLFAHYPDGRWGPVKN